jgi:integrase
MQDPKAVGGFFQRNRDPPLKSVSQVMGGAAKFTFLVFPHAAQRLRVQLANKSHDTHAIQAYLGHRSIMSNVLYAAFDARSLQEILARLTPSPRL